jgi:hypothetical protein
VVASDRLKNAEGDDREDEIISSTFTVDNTAPKIVSDTKTINQGFITVKISDPTSIIDEAQYSVDGGNWIPLLPINGLYDSKSNRFQISIEKLSQGEHYINLRASDSADNIANVTIEFKK